jgi:hypothetical protein
MGRIVLAAALAALTANTLIAGDAPTDFRVKWEKDFLTISGKNIPGNEIRVNYLEAYCRDGSTDRDWRETTIGHKTELVSSENDGRKLQLKCTLNDGVVVSHVITAVDDGIDFRLTATNSTKMASRAHWAQPCMRVDAFTGANKDTYLAKSFVFYDGKLTRLPTRDWATKARYVPGQVWAPKGVDRNDVNPRPLSTVVPSNGLIGCFSSDDSAILAMAWEPYQELFQGVVVCLHSDFRIGGLAPGETKNIRGKIYILDANVEKMLQHYRHDFPKQQK